MTWSSANSHRGLAAVVDAILFVTPEYNRSIPGALKNAIDWASRPWGRNSFDHIPAAVIGASVGQIGTAMGQANLRGVLSFCNARQMTSPEAYIQYSPEVFQDDGEVTDDSTRGFLRAYMAEFRPYIGMVLTVLPRPQEPRDDAQRLALWQCRRERRPAPRLHAPAASGPVGGDVGLEVWARHRDGCAGPVSPGASA